MTHFDWNALLSVLGTVAIVVTAFAMRTAKVKLRRFDADLDQQLAARRARLNRQLAESKASPFPVPIAPRGDEPKVCASANRSSKPGGPSPIFDED